MHCMRALRELVVVSLVIFAETVESRKCHEKFSALTTFYNDGTTHSACLDAAATVTKSGISEADKTSIVNKHNDYRSSVAATYKAANMQKMYWDDEIATIAQVYAEKCEFKHDKGWARSIPGRFGLGQNLAAGYNDWTTAIKGWYDEIKDFTYGSSGNVFSKIGHFTQVTAAPSAKIGCGYAECSNLSYKKLYVCNYGTPGNVGSAVNSPWKSGSKACEDCPTSCSNNLCDCKGKVCLNYGTLDVNACTCTCGTPKAMHVGDICSLDCSKGPDSCSWTKSDCKTYSNVPFQCPNTCSHCPYGGIDFKSSVVPEMTTSSSSGSGNSNHTDATPGDQTTQKESSGSRTTVDMSFFGIVWLLSLILNNAYGYLF